MDKKVTFLILSFILMQNCLFSADLANLGLTEEQWNLTVSAFSEKLNSSVEESLGEHYPPVLSSNLDLSASKEVNKDHKRLKRKAATIARRMWNSSTFDSSTELTELTDKKPKKQKKESIKFEGYEKYSLNYSDYIVHHDENGYEVKLSMKYLNQYIEKISGEGGNARYKCNFPKCDRPKGKSKNGLLRSSVSSHMMPHLGIVYFCNICNCNFNNSTAVYKGKHFIDCLSRQELKPRYTKKEITK